MTAPQVRVHKRIEGLEGFRLDCGTNGGEWTDAWDEVTCDRCLDPPPDPELTPKVDLRDDPASYPIQVVDIGGGYMAAEPGPAYPSVSVTHPGPVQPLTGPQLRYKQWLVEQGYSEERAEERARKQVAP